VEKCEFSQELLAFLTISTIQILGGLAISPDAQDVRVGWSAHRMDCGFAAE
jgi:hypothetical protein